jgi:hypothetical protein
LGTSLLESRLAGMTAGPTWQAAGGVSLPIRSPFIPKSPPFADFGGLAVPGGVILEFV